MQLALERCTIRDWRLDDAASLAKVKMPNRDGFALPEEWKHGRPRLEGYTNR